MATEWAIQAGRSGGNVYMIAADPSAAIVATWRRAGPARIEPRELLEIFDDPYAALAAAVVVLPMQKGKWCEVAKNDNSRFLASKWFSLICGALDLDEHNWRAWLGYSEEGK